MQTIKETLTSMPTTMISHSDEVCPHKVTVFGQPQEKKHYIITLPDGTAGCPICFMANENKKLVANMGLSRVEVDKGRNKVFFEKYNMLTNETLRSATLENYEDTRSNETRLAKQLSINFITANIEGKRGNLILQGSPGVGKSHLAYAICVKLNDGERKVMFVSMSELLGRIKDTFRKDAVESEKAIITRLIDADLLAIDDLGAEVGNVNNHNSASDFISRVIFAVLDGRQGKSTIFTTNLTGDKIKQIYDMRTVSRIFTNYKYIAFKETKDYRKVEIPF